MSLAAVLRHRQPGGLQVVVRFLVLPRIGNGTAVASDMDEVAIQDNRRLIGAQWPVLLGMRVMVDGCGCPTRR